MPTPSSSRHKLPSYLSESTFRIYEPHLARAVSAWPKETEFGPQCFLDSAGHVLSGNTFVARFRDAVTSLRRFQWETNVDVAKLTSMAGEFCLTLDAGTGSVWFRNKTVQGRPAEFLGDARKVHPEKSSKTVRDVWLKWEVDEVRAVALLIHTNRLVGPFILEGQVAAEVVTELEERLNVALTWDGANGRTIIT